MELRISWSWGGRRWSCKGRCWSREEEDADRVGKGVGRGGEGVGKLISGKRVTKTNTARSQLMDLNSRYCFFDTKKTKLDKTYARLFEGLSGVHVQ